MNTDDDLRLHGGGGGLLGVFALLLAGSVSAALGTSVNDVLAILVHLQLHDAYLEQIIHVQIPVSHCSQA